MQKFTIILLMAVFAISSPVLAEHESGYSLEHGDLKICGRTFENFEAAHKIIISEAKHQKTDENFVTYIDDKSKIIWNFTTEKKSNTPCFDLPATKARKWKAFNGYRSRLRC